jgi:hypothetical protein
MLLTDRTIRIFDHDRNPKTIGAEHVRQDDRSPNGNAFAMGLADEVSDIIASDPAFGVPTEADPKNAIRPIIWLGGHEDLIVLPRSQFRALTTGSPLNRLKK